MRVRLIALLETKDLRVMEIASGIRDLFPENAWWSGKCAGFAFGLHGYLSGLGIKSKVFVNASSDHVFVRVGKVTLDACRYNIHDTTPTVDITDLDPREVPTKFGIAASPKDIREAVRRLRRLKLTEATDPRSRGLVKFLDVDAQEVMDEAWDLADASDINALGDMELMGAVALAESPWADGSDPVVGAWFGGDAGTRFRFVKRAGFIPEGGSWVKELF